MSRFVQFLLSIYLYTLFIVLSLVVTVLFTAYIVCLGLLIPSRRRTLWRIRRAISWYGMVIIASGYPFIRLRYEDHGGSDEGVPYIVICNHRSALDAYLMAFLPHELVQIVNVWPFRIPVLGIVARIAGYLNIRMMPTEQFREKALNLIKDGVTIIFFPEGTRSLNRMMGSFHGSAFRLAMESKAAIVPLCISGCENVMAKGSALLNPGLITIRRMPAIRPEEYENLTAFALKNRVWKIMDRELSAMESNL
jgi:1-acyl-sn-glycerol-3-phosphate acyltransferase